MDLGRWLVVIGVAIAIIGVVVMVGGLPGDIAWKKGNVAVYIPIATSIVLSVVLTALINLLRR